MVDRDRETVLLEREYKKRLAVEQARAKGIERISKKRALKKKVKDLRFKQSKVGRTLVAGKIVLGRIGTVAGKVGEGFEKATAGMERGTKATQQAVRGAGLSPMEKAFAQPMKKGKKKKQPKPFDLNEALKRMPQ